MAEKINTNVNVNLDSLKKFQTSANKTTSKSSTINKITTEEVVLDDIEELECDNSPKKEEKSILGKVGDFFKSAGATAVTGAASLVEGVGQFGEAVVDVAAIAGTAINTSAAITIDGYQALAGLVTGKEWESVTKKMWNNTKSFVSTKYVTNLFDSFYDKTDLGQGLKNNAFGFETTRSIGSGIGYVAGVTALTIATAGAGGIAVGASSAGTSAGISAANFAVTAGAAGVGKGTQDSWADGASLGEGLIAGGAKGLWEGAQYYIGGKIGTSALLGEKGLAKGFQNEVANKVVNSASRVILDGLDGGVEGIVQPLIDSIYKDAYYDENGNKIKFGENTSLIEKYKELFDDNGGWKGVATNAAVGSFSSLLGEISSPLIQKIKNKPQTDSNSQRKVETPIDDNNNVYMSPELAKLLKHDVSTVIDTMNKKYNGTGIEALEEYLMTGNINKITREGGSRAYIGSLDSSQLATTLNSIIKEQNVHPEINIPNNLTREQAGEQYNLIVNYLNNNRAEYNKYMNYVNWCKKNGVTYFENKEFLEIENKIQSLRDIITGREITKRKNSIISQSFSLKHLDKELKKLNKQMTKLDWELSNVKTSYDMIKEKAIEATYKKYYYNRDYRMVYQELNQLIDNNHFENLTNDNNLREQLTKIKGDYDKFLISYNNKKQQLNDSIETIRRQYDDISLDSFSKAKEKLNQIERFFAENNTDNSNYGTDQGVIKKNYNISQVRDQYGNVKNIRTASQNYLDVKSYVAKQYNMDLRDAAMLMAGVDSVGACSYAATANEIFASYIGKENKFLKDFGFPMYYIENGQKKLNSMQLLTDLYAFENHADNGGNLLIRTIDGKTTINPNAISDIADRGGRYNLSGKNQKYMSLLSNGKETEVINNYLKSKNRNLEYTSSVLHDQFFNGNFDISSLKSSIAKEVNKNNVLTLDISTKRGHILMKNLSGGANVSTSSWKEGGAHSMFVTGVTNKGFTLSSWGEKYLITFEELKNKSFTLNKIHINN